LMVAITVAHVCILATEETELQQPAPAKSLWDLISTNTKLNVVACTCHSSYMGSIQASPNMNGKITTAKRTGSDRKTAQQVWGPWVQTPVPPKQNKDKFLDGYCQAKLLWECAHTPPCKHVTVGLVSSPNLGNFCSHITGKKP
jgi:hypothetical protein